MNNNVPRPIKISLNLTLYAFANTVSARQPFQFIIAVTFIMMSISIHARPTKLDLPAAPLPQALDRLARTIDLQIAHDSIPVSIKQAPALNGDYTPDEAINDLLASSGLQAQKNNAGQYIIAQASTDDTKPAPATLPEIKVTGYADEDTPGNPSYTRVNASTASRINLPLMKTPISTQVVPRSVMDDQQAVLVEDVVRNVSGVFAGDNVGAVFRQFFVRGFNLNFAGYRDGYRVPIVDASLANIERVEVVKGAAANLYGQIEPGGMINYVTKRPQAQSYYSLNQQFGSYGQYQTLLDATGAVNKDGTLLFRFNAEYLNRDSFRDFRFHDRVFLAPSVTWKMTRNTQFDLDFIYSHETLLIDYGIPAVGNRPARLPRSRFLGEPVDKGGRQTLYNTVATLNHAFNDDWQVRARFSYFRRDEIDPQHFIFSLNEQTGVAQRGYSRGDALNDTYMSNVDVTGRFSM